ncbi:hypothetical protein M0804_006721 [Polistes exclamans]|nr:hypothetical protein M0804_006721 [Polistes exclamans]
MTTKTIRLTKVVDTVERRQIDRFLACHRNAISLRKPTETSVARTFGITREHLNIVLDTLDQEFALQNAKRNKTVDLMLQQ